jgi:hypothetical protein
MFFGQEEWAQAGKALLFMSGVACVSLAFYRDAGALSVFLRVWVGFFGGLSILVALADARR